MNGPAVKYWGKYIVTVYGAAVPKIEAAVAYRFTCKKLTDVTPVPLYSICIVIEDDEGEPTIVHSKLVAVTSH